MARNPREDAPGQTTKSTDLQSRQSWSALGRRPVKTRAGARVAAALLLALLTVPALQGLASAGEPGKDIAPCELFDSPTPAPACEPSDEPCEIHEGINRMGAMYEAGAYDNDTMLSVILAYWDESSWDLPDSWGAHGLDGFVVYAVARTAFEYHAEMAAHPETVIALECMLRDHADRGLPTTADNGERWFHGVESDWNTWSEDYMAMALGYAAADAWLASPWAASDYFGEYYDKVDDAVSLAFSISHEGPHTLRAEIDPDPLAPQGEPSIVVRNHGEYSPVYGMALLKHVWDINLTYHAADLPTRYTCANKPATYDALYRWVALKIEPNPEGGGYTFRTDACQRRDGVLSYCDDRPNDPVGEGGAWREPGHYPLAAILPHLCISEHAEYFGPPCQQVGPAGIPQREYNYYYNNVFFDEGGDEHAQVVESAG